MASHAGNLFTSTIIPCFNLLDFKCHCMRALFQDTRPLFELIVIDHGSTEGIGMDLVGVQHSSSPPLKVVASARNLGSPAAINQILRLARGPWIQERQNWPRMNTD